MKIPTDSTKLHEYIKLLIKIQRASRVVINEIKLTPGGDQYIYHGSTNEIDSLWQAHDDLEYFLITNNLEELY